MNNIFILYTLYKSSYHNGFSGNKSILMFIYKCFNRKVNISKQESENKWNLFLIL